MGLSGLEGRCSTIELRPRRTDQQFRGCNNIGTQSLPPPATIPVNGRIRRNAAQRKGKKRAGAILPGWPAEDIPKRR